MIKKKIIETLGKNFVNFETDMLANKPPCQLPLPHFYPNAALDSHLRILYHWM